MGLTRFTMFLTCPSNIVSVRVHAKMARMMFRLSLGFLNEFVHLIWCI